MGAGLGEWRERVTESESLYSVILQTQETSAKSYLVAVAEDRKVPLKLLTITDNVDQDSDNLFDSFAAATMQTKHESVGYNLVIIQVYEYIYYIWCFCQKIINGYW